MNHFTIYVADANPKTLAIFETGAQTRLHSIQATTDEVIERIDSELARIALLNEQGSSDDPVALSAFGYVQGWVNGLNNEHERSQDRVRCSSARIYDINGEEYSQVLRTRVLNGQQILASCDKIVTPVYEEYRDYLERARAWVLEQ